MNDRDLGKCFRCIKKKSSRYVQLFSRNRAHQFEKCKFWENAFEVLEHYNMLIMGLTIKTERLGEPFRRNNHGQRRWRTNIGRTKKLCTGQVATCSIKNIARMTSRAREPAARRRRHVRWAIALELECNLKNPFTGSFLRPFRLE